MNPRLAPLLALIALGRSPALAQTTNADEQYRYLAGLVEKGMHELAVDEAQSFLREHPKHEKAALARYRLAGALWELGRRDEAAREYDALGRLQRFEYRAECLFRCGEAALERGDEARARAAFEAVLAAGQEYLLAPARFALAEADFRARRFAEAEPRYEELLAAHPDCAEAPLARRALAWCAFERGDTAETARRARAFLAEERDPARRDELSLLLGEALLASDPAEALKAFRALTSAEQAGARLRGEGFALAALGDHTAAAKAFEKLLERDADGPFAREAALQAGIERLRAGDARSAVSRLRAAARGGDAETLYWLATAEKQSGDVEAALETLERTLRAKPDDELARRAQVLRGDCLAAAGRAEEAQAAYEASGSGQALHAAAVAALNRGDAADAARLAERLLASGPSEREAAAARVVLAEAHFAAEQWTEAERAFTAALRAPADPSEAARLASRLAWCRYLAGDLAGAEQRFAAVVERNDGTGEAEEALAMLARVAEERGDAAAARAAAQRYVERHANGRFADQALLTLARASEGADARKRRADWLARFPESELRVAVLLELADLELAAGAHADAARRYAEIQELAPASPEAARAAYGAAWCAWERKDLDSCRRALAPLARAKELDPALRAAALELLVWAEVEGGDLEAGVAAWRALAAARGDEARRLDSARRVLAALRGAQRLDDAEALLEECRASLATPALAAEAVLEGAYLALERSDPAAAEAALARARKAGADPASLLEASFHVGEARLAAGDSERALSLFEGAASGTHPRAADALYKLGFVRLSRGDVEGAERALAELAQRHPESELAGEARFLRGECAFRARRFEPAAELFSAVAKASSGELRARALFRAGVAYGELGRFDECGGALTELARQFPDFPNLAEGELWRGRALAARGQGRAARAAFERTLALDQGELAARARLGLGALHEAEGRLDDALSEYLKVALLYAHDEPVAEALFGAGRVLEAQGDATKALARYRELAEDHPESGFAARARERVRALGGSARASGER